MSINGVWAYLVLEALLIAGLAILVLLWLYLRQRKLWRNAAPPDAATPVVDSYPAALARRIEESEARLDELDKTPDTHAGDRHTVITRLAYLRAEHASADEDSTAFWTTLGETLQGLGSNTSTPPADTTMTQDALVKSLQARIQAYTMRIANLEKFKSNFFELKQQYAETIHLSRDVQVEVDKALPDAQQTPELKQALQRLKAENTQLEQQLIRVEQEFENIMRNIRTLSEPSGEAQSHADISNSMDNIDQGMTQIKQVIDTQDQQIRQLQTVVSRLELEIQDKEKLQKTLDELNDQKDQLSDVMAILEEENSFLQQQVAALLEQGLTEDERNSRRAEEAEARLKENQQIHAELENQYAAIEQKYLAACEEIQRLRE